MELALFELETEESSKDDSIPRSLHLQLTLTFIFSFLLPRWGVSARCSLESVVRSFSLPLLIIKEPEELFIEVSGELRIPRVQRTRLIKESVDSI